MRKQEFNSKHLPSPARRGSRSRTASPPASLAIRKAPSASVESIEPRPPRPCEVGRPKGGEGKTDANLTIFLAPAAPGTPTRRHALGRLPTPPPLPEILLLGLHKKLPSAPPASTQEVRNPKIGQQLGAQPTPRFRVMLDALLDAMFDPWPPFTFCCPQASRSGRRSFDSKLISLPPLDEVPVHVSRFAARVSCDSKASERPCR